MISRPPGYWRRLEYPRTPLFAGFSDMLARRDLAFPTAMPDLRGATTLMAATDASGEHSGASYLTYGLLIVDHDQIGDWLGIAGDFRQDYLLDRRMSFKALRDKQRLRALGPFLDLTSTLEGYLVVVAVERAVRSVFDAPFPNADTEWIRTLRRWPQHVLEQAGFFSHLIGVMLSGLASEGQNLLWLLDEGSIAANDQRLSELTRLVASTTAAYIPFRMNTLKVATTRADGGSLAVEDLCSIPDLVAGAWSAFLQECDQAGIMLTQDEQRHQLVLPAKTRTILSWWESAKRSLECVASRVRRLPGGDLEWSLIDVQP